VTIVNLEFFAKLETVEQIILLLALLSALGMTAWLIRWIVLKIIEFFTGSINSEGKLVIRTKHNVSAEQKTHVDCPLVKDLLQILQSQQVMLNKVFHIRDKEILSEQMAYIEQRVDLAANQYEKSFCNLLEKSGKKDYLYSSEYISYRALIEFTREKVLTKFRHMCKENHLTEKSDDDFNEYVQNHVILILDMISNNSKSFFPYYLTIPGYLDSISSVRIEVKKHIQEAIYNARTCSINGKIKIDTLVADFAEEYERLTGLKPKRLDL